MEIQPIIVNHETREFSLGPQLHQWPLSLSLHQSGQLLRMDLDMAWIGSIHEIGETWQLLPAWAKDDSNFDDRWTLN